MSLDHADPGDEPTGPSAIGLVNVLLKRRWSLFRWTAGVALCVVILTVAQPRTYTALGSFVPESDVAGATRLAGLAAQFGIAAGAVAGTSESPMFYGDLLRARPLLASVLGEVYRPRSGSPLSESLLDLWDVSGDTPEERLNNGIEELEEALTISVDHETAVVTLAVRTRWPGASQQVAARMFELVNEFNLETRQSRAAGERRFVEGRLAQSRAELREAEDRLQRFLQSNRDFRNSPQLAFAHERLQRDVTMRQQVYASLVQVYEQARIDEVRNTPVVTIVQSPVVPAEADSRHLLAKLMLAAILGGLIGMALALWRDYVEQRTRDGAADALALHQVWRDIVEELRTPTRLPRRILRG